MVFIRDIRFRFKQGQIGNKRENSRTFEDLAPVHFGSASQNILKTTKNSLGFPTSGVNLTRFRPKYDTRDLYSEV